MHVSCTALIKKGWQACLQAILQVLTLERSLHIEHSTSYSCVRMSLSSELCYQACCNLILVQRTCVGMCHLAPRICMGHFSTWGSALFSPAGRLVLGPGRAGTLCKEFCLRASCMLMMGGPSSRL